MPFTLRNLKTDLEDVGSNFDGAPDLEFRLATMALELEQSGLGYQRVPPDLRGAARAAPAGRGRLSAHAGGGTVLSWCRPATPGQDSSPGGAP